MRTDQNPVFRELNSGRNQKELDKASVMMPASEICLYAGGFLDKQAGRPLP
jgi:hypothetical protein